MTVPLPIIDDGLEVAEAADPAGFIRLAFEGGAVEPLIQARLDGLGAGEGDAVRLLELGLLFQLVGERERAMTCQASALELERIYRHPTGEPPSLRLLVLATAGDLMANTPLELMLEGRGVEITKVYVDQARPWPLALPAHDLAFMAVSESDPARPVLEALIGIEGRWPRPMINRASRVLELARERLYRRLAGAPGLTIPPTVAMTRDALAAAITARAFPGDMAGHGLPVIVRPVGSHAGKALERIDDWEALEGYLAATPADAFYLSPFVDYAGADALYRKYRIAFFAGRPFLCHMAVSSHWMVHYLNAGMAESAAKRAEEAAAMADFDADFVQRHAQGLEALHARLDLDYFAVDCAELPDGSLLIFEADVAMVIHDLDPEALYPYKKPQMRKVFEAFESFLRQAASDVNSAGPSIVNQSSAG